MTPGGLTLVKLPPTMIRLPTCTIVRTTPLLTLGVSAVGTVATSVACGLLATAPAGAATSASSDSADASAAPSSARRPLRTRTPPSRQTNTPADLAPVGQPHRCA